jgi:hypothetical protein
MRQCAAPDSAFDLLSANGTVSVTAGGNVPLHIPPFTDFVSRELLA